METKHVVKQIGNTPLHLSVYSVESSPTKMNEPGVLEIIFCLKGTVRFSYAYEEFVLHEGEFVSVDRDAYYLYSDVENTCVSFIIDLKRYRDLHPNIESMLFVCEGCAVGTTEIPKYLYSRLKGFLISLLKEFTKGGTEEMIMTLLDRVVAMFVEHFNIYFYLYGNQDIDPSVREKLNLINDYMNRHFNEKVSLDALAAKVDLSSGYASELMRRYGLGFRKMLGYIRANMSERFLLRSDMTIIEISEACGFSDPKYYYAAFKSWYRCTPRQFRQRYGKSRQDRITYLPVETVRDYLDDLQMEHYKEIFVDGVGI